MIFSAHTALSARPVLLVSKSTRVSGGIINIVLTHESSLWMDFEGTVT